MSAGRHRYYELYGATLYNLGAAYMFETVVRRLRSTHPGWRPTTVPQDAEVQVRAELGALPMAPVLGHSLGRRQEAAGWLYRRIPPGFTTRVHGRYGVVAPESVEAVLDISGFRYSDRWGPQKAKEMDRYTRWLARRDVPFVLLPQAVGPLDDPEVRRHVVAGVRRSRAVFCRDTESRHHLLDALGGDGPVVGVAPDLTLSDQVAPSEEPPSRESFVVLVPNVRMVASPGTPWANDYVPTLQRLAAAALRSGRRVHVVVHSLERGDRSLADEVADGAGAGGCTVVECAHPRAFKAYVAHADACVASRYHAALGSLSMSVPTLVLGWAHKYESLARDFGIPDRVFAAPSGDVDERFAALLADPCGSRRHQSSEYLDRAEAALAEVWAAVDEAFG